MSTPDFDVEKDNFRIDSTGWKAKTIDWKTFKVNTKWDVFEYTEGKLKWEQLFTWDGAIRETKKAWKRMPNKYELREMYFMKLNHTKAWFLSWNSLCYSMTVSFYWSKDEKNTTHAFYFNSELITGFEYEIARQGIKSIACSVRCI